MLQVSNTKQVSLKKETKKQLKKETQISIIHDDLENLILKLSGNMDSSKKDISNDTFDKADQLNKRSTKWKKRRSEMR